MALKSFNIQRKRHLLKLKSTSIVAFVFRFKTQAFADSSQLGSLTEVNFPVSDPREFWRKKRVKDVFTNRFYDAFCVVVVISEVNHTECREKYMKRSPSKHVVHMCRYPKVVYWNNAASFNWLFRFSNISLSMRNAVHCFTSSKLSQPDDRFFSALFSIFEILLQSQSTWRSQNLHIYFKRNINLNWYGFDFIWFSIETNDKNA